jgi:4-nitrophenyl phosphatase
MDTTISYEKLRKASLLIRGGVPFIGSNPDKTFPTPEGQAPGAGSIQAAVQAASGVSPLIIGKPKPEMFTQAMATMNVSPIQTLVVGDRLETDILGGQNANCRTAVVLSGVTDKQEALAWEPEADIVVADLTELINSLP